MKFLNFVKKNKIELVFLLLIAVFFYLYFVVYMTLSKEAWYNEMNRQVNVVIDEFKERIGQ